MTVVDLESGISNEDKAAIQRSNSAQDVERHQAEEPPLTWSAAKGTWVAAAAAAEDSDSSEHTSSNTVQSQKVEDQARNDPSSNNAGMPPNRLLSSMSEPIYVQFEDNDPDNPFDWSLKRKWIITCVG